MNQATTEVFTHAGVSFFNGEYKARFTNDLSRVKLLTKNGHTDINFVELPQPMTKLEAIVHLQSLDEFRNNPQYSFAIDTSGERQALKNKRISKKSFTVKKSADEIAAANIGVGASEVAE